MQVSNDEKCKAKQLLVEYFKSGEKSNKIGQIGLEIEHFVVDKNSKEAVAYFGDRGVEAVLQELAPFYDVVGRVDGNINSLSREKSYITLEPGAQLELSIGVYSSIADIEKAYERFLCQIEPILKKKDLQLITIGYQPKSKVEQIELIPKNRYRIMDSHFATSGTMGKNMMRGTASTQVAVDYFSEQDFINKYKLANILSPIFAFLTDNTPVFESQKAMPMMRSTIWQNVDSKRCGLVPNTLDKADFSYGDYADFILNNPLCVYQKNDGTQEYAKQQTAKQLYGDDMTKESLEHSLSMFFPNVRLRQYIEIRVADSMPIEFVLGYVALIKGIFYNELGVIQLLKMFENVGDLDVEQAFLSLQNDGLDANVYNQNFANIMDKLLSIAQSSLDEKERKYLFAIKRLAGADRELPIFSQENIVV